MIKQLLFYNFRYFSRSHKFIVPLVIYLTAFAVLYATKPLEAMNTYGMTAMFIFIIATLIACNFMEIEDPVQQQIVLLSLRNNTIYYFQKCFCLDCCICNELYNCTLPCYIWFLAKM